MIQCGNYGFDWDDGFNRDRYYSRNDKFIAPEEPIRKPNKGIEQTFTGKKDSINLASQKQSCAKAKAKRKSKNRRK